jgi:signal transduction histidine kinase
MNSELQLFLLFPIVNYFIAKSRRKIKYKRIHQKKNEKKQEFHEVILRNCYRLYRLTEDVLDVTKIESKTLKMNKEIIPLNEIIENVVKDYREIISKKRYGSDQISIDILFYQSFCCIKNICYLIVNIIIIFNVPIMLNNYLCFLNFTFQILLKMITTNFN